MTVINAVIKGKQPVIDTLNVTPTTSAQQITAPQGTDGYSPVNVSAVTSSIDANIVAGNIKNGVSILGVTGNYRGTTPTGTKNITSNGTHNVANYEYADVQVPTTAPEVYRVFRVNNGKIENSITTPFMPLPSTATDIGDYCYCKAYASTPASVLSGAIDLSGLTTTSGQYACYSMFQNCIGITSVDLSGLTTISGSTACHSMFYNCTGITSVDLSSLTTISGQTGCAYMFYNCTGITSINLSRLTTISGGTACQEMFRGCTGLTSIDLSSLTTISGGSNPLNIMFSGCTGLKTVKLNALNTISGILSPSYWPPFLGCTKLESVELGGLKASTFASRKDQIAYLFNNTTGSEAPNGTTVHFPSNFDPSDPSHTFDASTLSGYPTFGGSASYIHVAFDLPATE